MILYDTGAIVAAANASDQHHHACVTLLTGLRLARRRLLVPATVVAEAGYMIRKHRMVHPRHVDAFTLLPESIG